MSNEVQLTVTGKVEDPELRFTGTPSKTPNYGSPPQA